jgi:hypothetical protein
MWRPVGLRVMGALDGSMCRSMQEDVERETRHWHCPHVRKSFCRASNVKRGIICDSLP